MQIKVGDTVKVIAGDDRGQTGKVIRVLTRQGPVVVEGVNKVFKHVKRSQKNPQGGRLSMEMPIHVSNVMLVCPPASQPSRVGMRQDGRRRQRAVLQGSGAAAGLVTPSEARSEAPIARRSS